MISDKLSDTLRIRLEALALSIALTTRQPDVPLVADVIRVAEGFERWLWAATEEKRT